MHFCYCLGIGSVSSTNRVLLLLRDW